MTDTTGIVTLYDARELAIDPTAISDAADRLKALVGDIGDELVTVTGAMDNLSVDWFGGGASEADDFNRRWSAAFQTLFGSEKDPSTGILNQLYSGMVTAAANYDGGESAIEAAFVAFQGQMQTVLAGLQNQPGSGAAPSAPPQNITDQDQAPYHSTFVQEVW